MIISDDFVLPYPNTDVTKVLDIKAQNKAPPLSKPVTWAYPVGKASSQPKS